MNNTAVVLLVEDEPIMLINAQDALEEAGFKVIEASSGEEAATLLTNHSSDVIAMVTDIRLGSGINGWELAREARERNASLPVVYQPRRLLRIGPHRECPKASWYRSLTRRHS